MSERKSHQHRGKFTEGLLNSEMVLKALNIKAGQTILDAGCGNGYTSNKKYVDSVFPIGIRASFFSALAIMMFAGAIAGFLLGDMRRLL